MPPPGKQKKPRPSSRSNSRHSISTATRPEKTEILINVYDLVPPGSLSSLLWFLGSSLLHTGVVIRSLNREYAFGGHNRPNLSGVYWSKPHVEPPGGTWRCELLQGFTLRTEAEIEEIILDASRKFLGTSYNLLSNNCNHFTSYLCSRLVGKEAPGWINRAATIGIALPCVVPREWVSPPDADTADGELVEDEDDGDERTSMLRQDYKRARNSFHGSQAGSEAEAEEWDSDRDRRRGGKGKGKGVLRDTAGRIMPATERAPDPVVAS